MAGEVIVDALPYIDQGYDEPGIREAVSIHITSLLVIKETKCSGPKCMLFSSRYYSTDVE